MLGFAPSSRSLALDYRHTGAVEADTKLWQRLQHYYVLSHGMPPLALPQHLELRSNSFRNFLLYFCCKVFLAASSPSFLDP